MFGSGTDGGHLGRYILEATRSGRTDLDSMSSALDVGRADIDAMLDMASSIAAS